MYTLLWRLSAHECSGGARLFTWHDSLLAVSAINFITIRSGGSVYIKPEYRTRVGQVFDLRYGAFIRVIDPADCYPYGRREAHEKRS